MRTPCLHATLLSVLFALLEIACVRSTLSHLTIEFVLLFEKARH
jgi:hypothetical protein